MRYIPGMQLVRQMILAVCAFGMALTGLAEQRSMESYKSIVDRNPFGLKDPPVLQPPPTNKPATEKKPEDFYLTGITTIGTPKRPKAYLLSKDASKKLYDEKYYTMTVGDKQGEVTMKEIDPVGRRVLIAYLGEDRWLSMKDNGVPAPSGPPAGAMPLVPGAPGAIPPPGGAVPVPLPNAGGAQPVHQPQPLSYPNAANPNRRVPRSTYNGAANNTYVNPTYAPAANPVYTAPGMATANANAAMAGPQTDAEVVEQMVRMKAPDKFSNLPPNIPKPPTPF